MAGTYRRGDLAFEATVVRTDFTTPDEAMFDVSCSPPPAGKMQRYAWPASVGPFLDVGFMQPDDQRRVLKYAAESDEELNIDTLLTDLGKQFNFGPLEIKTEFMPKAWNRPLDCFNVSVCYRITWYTWEVIVRAATEIIDGAIAFPASDLVASFRIHAPVQFRFVRRSVWNPECCKDKEPLQREEDVTDPYPALNTWNPNRPYVLVLPDGTIIRFYSNENSTPAIKLPEESQAPEENPPGTGH